MAIVYRAVARSFRLVRLPFNSLLVMIIIMANNLSTVPHKKYKCSKILEYNTSPLILLFLNNSIFLTIVIIYCCNSSYSDVQLEQAVSTLCAVEHLLNCTGGR